MDGTVLLVLAAVAVIVVVTAIAVYAIIYADYSASRRRSESDRLLESSAPPHPAHDRGGHAASGGMPSSRASSGLERAPAATGRRKTIRFGKSVLPPHSTGSCPICDKLLDESPSSSRLVIACASCGRTYHADCYHQQAREQCPACGSTQTRPAR